MQFMLVINLILRINCVFNCIIRNFYDMINMVISMDLKRIRASLGLTQKEVSEIVNVPLRTYQNYENDKTKEETIKYRYIRSELMKYGKLSDDALTIDQIKILVEKSFKNYDVKFCYLFGDYATDKITTESGLDLLISSNLEEKDFYSLVDNLRSNFNLKILLISIDKIKNNVNLIDFILASAVKIY